VDSGGLVPRQVAGPKQGWSRCKNRAC